MSAVSPPPLVIPAETVQAATPYPALIAALDTAFRAGCAMPPRHHHTVAVPGEPDATLLLMPAWTPGDKLGVKLVSVFPGNGPRGLPAVQGSYLLSCGRTGRLLALIDGGELTARRTAAASALAARHLARPDADSLLVVGGGRLAPELARAHAAARPSGRPLRRIRLWARCLDQAEAVAATLRAEGLPATAALALEAAARDSDIVSCATLSTTPLVHGAWLAAGAHLDLVGAFTPAMRECDDFAVARATVFVDTRDGALHEGGDLVQAIAAGAFAADRVAADLAELCRGAHPGRRDRDEVTLFKSVGCALEDLAAATLVHAAVTRNDARALAV